MEYTGNRIGEEGTRIVCETLKRNSTLTELKLKRIQREGEKRKENYLQ